MCAHVRPKIQDVGINGQIDYELRGPDDSPAKQFFKITSVATPTGYVGRITTTKVLDNVQLLGGLVLIVQVNDRSSSKLKGLTLAEVNVTIVPRNLYPPIFQPPKLFQITEPITTTNYAAAVEVSDNDQGKEGVLFYSLISGHLDKDKKAIFRITQQGTIFATRSLDFEEFPVQPFKLIVKATDQGDIRFQRSSTGSVSIEILDANDNFPEWSSSDDKFTCVIREDALLKQQFCHVIQATDADSDAFKPLAYSLEDDARGFFGIVPESGSLILLKALDRAVATSHTVSVRVKDKGGLFSKASASVTIQVTSGFKHPSVLQAQLSTLQVGETAKSGTVINTITITDLDGVLPDNIFIGTDADERSKWFKEENVPIALYANKFALKNTSKAGVLQVVVIGALDFDKDTRYLVTVYASDGGKQKPGQVSFRVKVTNENLQAPVFDRWVYTRTPVPENTAGASTLLKVSATDEKGSQLTYSISGNTAAEDLFVMNGDTLLLKSSARLDYEKEEFYHFNIIATDNGNPSKKTSVPVIFEIAGVNDNTPAFDVSTKNIIVAETALAATAIFLAKATDKDVGVGSNLTYGLNSPFFAVDPKTGVVSRTTTSLSNTAKVVISVSVRDSDDGFVDDTLQVTVTVAKCNLIEPLFDTSLYDYPIMTAQTNINDVVLTVNACMGGQDTLIYSRIDQSNNFFFVKPNGQVLLEAYPPLKDFYYSLKVKAQPLSCASNTASCKETGTTTVIVYYAKNIAISFGVSDYYVDVDECSGACSKDALVTIPEPVRINPHYVKLGTISYSTAAGSILRIDAQKGDVAIGDDDKFKAQSEIFTQKFDVRDSGGAGTGEAIVHVNIGDGNNNKPTITTIISKVEVNEAATVGSVVTRLEAEDKDFGINAQIQFLPVGKFPHKLFALSADGTVVVKSPLDYETMAHMYVLPVMASNSAAKIKLNSSIFELTIVLTDQNEKPPIFTSANINAMKFSFSISTINEGVDVIELVGVVYPENTVVSGVLGQVSATDQDKSPDMLVYEISLGQSKSWNGGRDDAESFEIDARTGTVKLKEGASFNREIITTDKDGTQTRALRVVYVHVVVRDGGMCNRLGSQHKDLSTASAPCFGVFVFFGCSETYENK